MKNNTERKTKLQEKITLSITKKNTIHFHSFEQNIFSKTCFQQNSQNHNFAR